MISFFSRLFKSAPSEPTAAKNTSSTHDSPIKRPKTDAPKNAAEQKSYGTELIRSALEGETAKEKNAARQRIGTLLDQGQVTLTQIQGDCQESDVLALCSYSSSAAAQALSSVTDQMQLATLANEAPTAQVRKAAAEKVTERAALDSMLKGAKGKDKNIYKIAKAGLSTFKAEDEALAKKHAYLESLCVDAERHAKKPFDHLYTHKFISLETDWQNAQTDATPELQARFDAGIARCQSTIDEEVNRSKEAALAEQNAKAAVINMENATSAVCKIAEELYATESFDEQQIEKIKADLEAQSQMASRCFADKKETSPTFETAHSQYVKTSEACHRLLQALQDQGSLPQNLKALKEADKKAGDNLRQTIASLLDFQKDLPSTSCPIAAQATEAISEWQATQRAKSAQRKALLDSVSELSRRAKGAALGGQIRRARGIYRELNEKRAQLEHIPQGLEKKLDQLDEVIAKLGDWHEFAVNPKKEELVAAMTALQESTLAPDDLAEKIHSLQVEWKVLCKGGENQDEELWQAFQQAADKAFEPCKKHFAEQADMREKNAKERNALCEQLEQYHEAYDWEKANWKDVEQTLRVARETWKTIWPVPRQQQKELQTRFDGVIDKIYVHINAAYDITKNKKEQLIILAEKARDSQDAKAAAEEIKQLQVNWKTIGRSYRKTDQQLWEQFRAVCDEVFAKRQAIFNEANAERDERIKSANAFIEKLQEQVKEGGAHLQTQGATIETLKEGFYAIEDLPKTQQHKFQDLLKEVDNKIAQHRSAAQHQAWETLFTLNHEVNAYEINPSESAKAALDTALNESKLPNGCTDILKSRVATGDRNESNSEEALAALRLLCIRSEIANDIESPASDKSLRMTYQVEALQQNFGNKANDTSEILAREWISHGGCPASQLSTLQERFLASAFNIEVASPSANKKEITSAL